jgi:hypothetical protein
MRGERKENISLCGAKSRPHTKQNSILSEIGWKFISRFLNQYVGLNTTRPTRVRPFTICPKLTQNDQRNGIFHSNAHTSASYNFVRGVHQRTLRVRPRSRPAYAGPNLCRKDSCILYPRGPLVL